MYGLSSSMIESKLVGISYAGNGDLKNQMLSDFHSSKASSNSTYRNPTRPPILAKSMGLFTHIPPQFIDKHPTHF